MMEMNALLMCCKEIRHNKEKGDNVLFESLSISVIANRSVVYPPPLLRPSHLLLWPSEGEAPTPLYLTG